MDNSVQNFKDKFLTFLEKSGAEILKTTNPYELFRFKCEEGLGIIYQGKKGVSSVGAADTAMEFFDNKWEWAASKNYERFEKPQARAYLLGRDGENCFYCTQELGDDITVEHLLSKANGGNDNFANLVLAHEECNVRAGSLSLKEKFELFHDMRLRSEAKLIPKESVLVGKIND